MICPLWQYPHWTTSSRLQAPWTACATLPPTPSMVVTSRSPTAETGVTHDAHRLAADVDGAGAALGHSAAVLGAGELKLVAQHPEQGGVRGDVDIALSCR